MFWIACISVLPFFAAWAQTELPEADCRTHSLRAEAIEQRLRYWRGLAVFHRWRLVQALPDRCVTNGTVDVKLVLMPPSNWSLRKVPYQVQTSIPFKEASGNPLLGDEKDNIRLASGVRRLVLRAEAHEDVRRFLDRFPLQSAPITSANGSARLQVSFVAKPVAGSPARRSPRLVFSEAVEGGVSAYSLPRMDSLPVRREILRLAEALSQLHPGCRPNWISAQWGQPLASGDPSSGEPIAKPGGRWEFEIELAGKGCPTHIRKAVNPDGSVLDMNPSGQG